MKTYRATFKDGSQEITHAADIGYAIDSFDQQYFMKGEIIKVEKVDSK